MQKSSPKTPVPTYIDRLDLHEIPQSELPQQKLGRRFSGRLRRRCIDCSKNWADYPSKLCPGCEAYREHTGAI